MSFSCLFLHHSFSLRPVWQYLAGRKIRTRDHTQPVESPFAGTIFATVFGTIFLAIFETVFGKIFGKYLGQYLGQYFEKYFEQYLGDGGQTQSLLGWESLSCCWVGGRTTQSGSGAGTAATTRKRKVHVIMWYSILSNIWNSIWSNIWAIIGAIFKQYLNNRTTQSGSWASGAARTTRKRKVHVIIPSQMEVAPLHCTVDITQKKRLFKNTKEIEKM